jgi:intracellular septation protein|tara:strand:- start:682 stop:1257 length:576 start_codon:yes stop_codon:yes gene_type:complete
VKLLFDFFPLILFFAAYKFWGIFTATAVAIAASLLQVGAFWFRNRRFETSHLVTLAVITVFGGLTIYLQDDTFIKWKPTIVYWLFAGIILGSHLIGKRSAIEHLLGEKMALPKKAWQVVNLSWGIFFVVAGVLNIYVAFYYGLELDPQKRTDTWVNFKVFGLMGLTLTFTIGQMFYIARHIEEPDNEQERI